MSILDNRLRLNRHQYEECRRYLAEFESLAQRLRADERRLQDEIERAVAAGKPGCARPLLDRHSRLARSIAAIEGQIAAAGDALAAAGDALAAAARELKRHELTAAQRAGLSERRRAPRTRPASSPSAGPDRGA
jgi:phage shock protein A